MNYHPIVRARSGKGSNTHSKSATQLDLGQLPKLLPATQAPTTCQEDRPNKSPRSNGLPRPPCRPSYCLETWRKHGDKCVKGRAGRVPRASGHASHLLCKVGAGPRGGELKPGLPFSAGPTCGGQLGQTHARTGCQQARQSIFSFLLWEGKIDLK